jgi:ADP-heptose:LPS heptosyltransferase
MSSPQKILTFRYGQLGDTLAAVPALWTIREYYPNAHLILLSENPASGHIAPASILPKSGLIDEYWHFKTTLSGRNIADIISLAIQIRQKQVDLLIYLAPSLRGKSINPLRDRLFFQLLAGVRHVAGFYESEKLPPKQHGKFLPNVKSEAECLLGRLAQHGIVPPHGQSPRNDLALTDEEIRGAETWWQTRQYIHAKSQCVALGVGAKWPSKLWPQPYFAELGQRLMNELNLFPVIFGGPADREIAKVLYNTWGQGIIAAGELNVRQSVALMQGMAFYVGNDTGSMHLAAAAGLRCVGIFAAQDWPGRWAPMGQGHHILRVKIDCEGCRLTDCPIENKCLQLITPYEVFKACQSVILEHLEMR